MNVKPRLQLLVKAGWREWLIVHIIKGGATENVQRSAKRVFAKIEDQFRRERYSIPPSFHRKMRSTTNKHLRTKDR